MKIDRELVDALIGKIAATCKDMKINIMEVCGTHTMAIGKSGMRQLLPANIKLISGPGCPVCVTHQGEIDNYLELAQRDKVIIATFGDLIRVPGSRAQGSLQQLKGEGAQVKLVYSTLDALKLAKDYPNNEVVFLGVGFETTVPTVAQAIIQAEKEAIGNFSVYSMHKVVPPALQALLSDQEVDIQGFILPGHVTTIIGLSPYQFVAREYKIPSVVAGFEAIDILHGIYILGQQLAKQEAKVELQYKRGVSPEGNPIARKIIEQVFIPGDAWWRGIGIIPNSGLHIRKEYSKYNAQIRFELPTGDRVCQEIKDNQQVCSCGEILKGKKLPKDCPAFKKACTPARPLGPCMVSTEGACAAYYRYDLE